MSALLIIFQIKFRQKKVKLYSSVHTDFTCV
jgi:hypothetical protein